MYRLNICPVPGSNNKFIRFVSTHISYVGYCIEVIPIPHPRHTQIEIETCIHSRDWKNCFGVSSRRWKGATADSLTHMMAMQREGRAERVWWSMINKQELHQRRYWSVQNNILLSWRPYWCLCAVYHQLLRERRKCWKQAAIGKALCRRFANLETIPRKQTLGTRSQRTIETKHYRDREQEGGHNGKRHLL